MTEGDKIVVHRRSATPRGRLTCIDLFSGAGGLAVGFRQTGWAILAANDVDRAAGATFRLNFPEAVFFEGPVGLLDPHAVLEECGLTTGDLDCLIGGPPCQSFSYNNHMRSAEDERARLFEYYLNFVKITRPKLLVMENVPGILTIGDNAVVNEINNRLAGLGYDVAIKILSAEQFGAPQVRRRVFIVGSRIGAGASLLPFPTHEAHGKKQNLAPKGQYSLELQNKTVQRPITVWEAIGDLPPLDNGGGEWIAPLPHVWSPTNYQYLARNKAKALYNHVCHALTNAMLERIKHVPEGGNWKDIPFELLPAGMQRARSSDHTKRYGRLSRSGLASTILTKCDPHWGAYVHPLQDRTISVREAARLQGFPDRFVFAGEASSKHYAQVGNAVPVQIASALGAAARKHLRFSEEMKPVPRFAAE